MHQTEGHNTPNGTSWGKIHITEITNREFRKADKDGATTGVVKFSQMKNKFISEG